MEVHFIRHGEAQHNVDRRLYGDVGYHFPHNRFSPLTSVGLQQAVKFREDRPQVDLVITSSLPRTLMTTLVLYGKIESESNSPIFVSDLVRETNYHHPCNERRTKKEIAKLYPSFDLSTLIASDDEDFKLGLDDIKHRCVTLTTWLKDLLENGIKSIAIVSHGSFLECYLKYIGFPIKSPIKNCEMVSMLLTRTGFEKIQ